MAGIERKNNSLTYIDTDGNRKTAIVAVLVDEDGEPVNALKVMARHVKTKWGASKGGSQIILEADAFRTGLVIRNNSDAQMYFRTDGDAGDGEGYPLDARRGYAFEAFGLLPSDPISIWCAEADKKWAVLYATNAEGGPDA